MTNRFSIVVLLAVVPTAFSFTGCRSAQADSMKEAPPAAKVVRDVDVTLFAVEHPEQFPLVSAVEHRTVSELVVTGSVNPDISRSVPVVSLASGRVTAIHARLGDTVNAGQVLLSVRSTDISGAFSDYRKAVQNEALARTQLERAKDLHNHGAMSLSDLQTAENAEENAKVDLETAEEHLHVLGSDPSKPNGVVDVLAPVSGVITDQQVTNAAAVQGLGSTPFTISDLSYIWIICDVYENDLASVHIGDPADIRMNAYPSQVFKGRVANIGAILDPQIRTAKVRIEMRNPGNLRVGMFATATFRSQTMQTHTAVPATAIVHIHDRDFVYAPAPGPEKKFRRIEVVSGDLLSGNLQEVKSGVEPGQQLVANALVLDHTIAQ